MTDGCLSFSLNIKLKPSKQYNIILALLLSISGFQSHFDQSETYCCCTRQCYSFSFSRCRLGPEDQPALLRPQRILCCALQVCSRAESGCQSSVGWHLSVIQAPAGNLLLSSKAFLVMAKLLLPLFCLIVTVFVLSVPQPVRSWPVLLQCSGVLQKEMFNGLFLYFPFCF